MAARHKKIGCCAFSHVLLQMGPNTRSRTDRWCCRDILSLRVGLICQRALRVQRRQVVGNRGERAILFDLSPSHSCIYPPDEEEEREIERKLDNKYQILHIKTIHCIQKEGWEHENN